MSWSKSKLFPKCSLLLKTGLSQEGSIKRLSRFLWTAMNPKSNWCQTLGHGDFGLENTPKTLEGQLKVGRPALFVAVKADVKLLTKQANK